MPKRSLEEASRPAEGLDNDWAGRSVMLRPAAARGKRLPDTRSVVCHEHTPEARGREGRKGRKE